MPNTMAQPMMSAAGFTVVPFFGRLARRPGSLQAVPGHRGFGSGGLTVGYPVRGGCEATGRSGCGLCRAALLGESFDVLAPEQESAIRAGETDGWGQRAGLDESVDGSRGASNDAPRFWAGDEVGLRHVHDHTTYVARRATDAPYKHVPF